MSETKELKRRFILVANQLIDEYQQDRNSSTSQEPFPIRAHPGDVAAIAAAISLLTCADAWDRVCTAVSDVLINSKTQKPTKKA